MSENAKLDIFSIFEQSYDYLKANIKDMSIFCFVNFLFLAFVVLIVGNLSNPLFLLWAAVYYVFWGYFFRYLFNRKPYYQSKIMADSLVPSTKIFMLTIITMSVFIALPLIPLFVSLPFNLSDRYIEFLDRYSDFLQRYMEESEILDLFLSFIFIFVAPVAFFRPFYAWISSIIGRSGAIKFAFSKTKNNYWQFLKVGIVMNVTFVILRSFSNLVGDIVSFDNFTAEKYIASLLFFALSSPFMIYFNIFIAKSYDFFFIESIAVRSKK